MKKFDYKKKPSIIRTLKEPPKKKKKINWDRVLFLGAIAVGLFFLVRHVYRSVALIEANGQVILESVKVNFINDIRLQRLHVTEGDTVQLRDTLFTYWNELHNDDGSKSIQISNSKDWVRKEMINVLSRISQKRAEIRETNALIRHFDDQMDTQVQMIMLDASDHTPLQNTTNQLVGLKSKSQLLASELAILYGQLNRLKKEQAQFLGTSGGYDRGLTQRSFRSHMYGIVGEIRIRPNEVCYEGDYLFTIHSPDQISIHAYFDQEHISRIFVRKVVYIQFPDGSKGRGYIKKYHISTKELPPEFQKKYEPTERTILAEIAPIDEHSSDLWKNFYKMDVLVSFPKYDSEIYYEEASYVAKTDECEEPIIP